jgi:radical SAM protein with 4Fe4S-binding SPASM domain
MANALLTTECNRACPYCFARGKVKSTSSDNVSRSAGDSRSYMAVEAFEQLIAFLKRSGDSYIGILGGEPTLHPRFTDVVRLALDNGFCVAVFSNGLMPTETAGWLANATGDLSIVVNTNHPNESPTREWEHTNSTLALLGQRGELGFNVYKSPIDAHFLIDLINKYELKRIVRVGLAMPVMGRNNVHLPLSDYSEVAAQLTDLAEACSGYEIRLGLDCGFTLCMFSPEQIGRLKYSNTELKLSCEPVLDVGPDLTVWSCFPLSSGANVRLADFASRAELTEFFYNEFAAFRRTGALNECLHCVHLARGVCKGGCTAHAMKAFGL